MRTESSRRILSPFVQFASVSLLPAGLGLGLGAFILGSIGKKFKFKWISAIGFMVVGIVFILLPLASRVTSHAFVQGLNSFLPHYLDINILHIIVLLAFIIGFAISFVFIPSNATIQIETSQEMRGRMYGLLNSLIGGVSFLPVALAGGLADVLGVGVVITGIGILMILLSISYLFLVKF